MFITIKEHKILRRIVCLMISLWLKNLSICFEVSLHDWICKIQLSNCFQEQFMLVAKYSGNLMYFRIYVRIKYSQIQMYLTPLFDLRCQSYFKNINPHGMFIPKRLYYQNVNKNINFVRNNITLLQGPLFYLILGDPPSKNKAKSINLLITLTKLKFV